MSFDSCISFNQNAYDAEHPKSSSQIQVFEQLHTHTREERRVEKTAHQQQTLERK